MLVATCDARVADKPALAGVDPGIHALEDDD